MKFRRECHRLVRRIVDDLLAAEAMQVAVNDDANGRDPRLGIHIGCHVGPVIETGGDLFGDTVNIAARVLDMAREDQIVITK